MITKLASPEWTLATSQPFRVTLCCIRQLLREHLDNFLNTYNFDERFRTLQRRTLY